MVQERRRGSCGPQVPFRADGGGQGSEVKGEKLDSIQCACSQMSQEGLGAPRALQFRPCQADALWAAHGASGASKARTPGGRGKSNR